MNELNEPILAAAGAIREALAEVTRQLEGMEALRMRQRRLLDALRAIEAINGPASPAQARAFSDFAELVQRVHTDQVKAARAPEPSSPIQAAQQILQEVGRPLHVRELIALIHSRGWFPTRDYESMRTTIVATLNVKSKAKDTYVKLAPAIYGLIEWGLVPEQEELG